jgi:hypothetical protein
MKVYELNPDSEGKWAWFFTSGPVMTPEHQESRAFFDAKPRVQIIRNNENVKKGQNRKLADFTNVNYDDYPCFSQRAKDLLGPHIDPLGQWLQLECGEAPYWLFNITNVVNALDVKASEILYFDDGQKVMRIAQFCFRAERLQGQLLFKPPQRAYNLVTQDFVDLVYKYQLTGFMFRLLWSSEEGPVPSNLKDYEKPRITGLEPR